MFVDMICYSEITALLERRTVCISLIFTVHCDLTGLVALSVSMYQLELHD